MAYSDQKRSHNLPVKAQLEEAITKNMSITAIDAIIESKGIKWGMRAGIISLGAVFLATFLIFPPRSNLAFAIMDYFHYVTTDLRTFLVFLGWASISGIIGVTAFKIGRMTSNALAKKRYTHLLVEKGLIKKCLNCNESIPPESDVCPFCGAKQLIT